MENLKHTKGPWTNGWGNGLTGPTTINRRPTVSGEDLDYIPISKGYETIAVAIQQDNPSGIEEMRANAKLIAAAPELLEALIEFVKMYKQAHDSGDWGNWDLNKDTEYIAAINAINKATK